MVLSIAAAASVALLATIVEDAVARAGYGISFAFNIMNRTGLGETVLTAWATAWLLPWPGSPGLLRRMVWTTVAFVVAFMIFTLYPIVF